MRTIVLIFTLFFGCGAFPLPININEFSHTATQLNQQRIQEDQNKRYFEAQEREQQRQTELNKKRLETQERERERQNEMSKKRLEAQEREREANSKREKDRLEAQKEEAQLKEQTKQQELLQKAETTEALKQIAIAEAKAKEEEAKQQQLQLEVEAQKAKIEAEKQERLTLQKKAEDRKKFVQDSMQLAQIQKERQAREAEDRAKQEAAYIATCGSMPKNSAWDGSLEPVRSFLKKVAHDPSSIEFVGCTTPKMTAKKCWMSYCRFRAKNMLGALVLTTKRFYMTFEEVISSD